MHHKPWYKRPLFWVFVVVSLCIIGAMQDDDKPAPEPAAAQSPNDVYREPSPEEIKAELRAEPQGVDPGLPGWEPRLHPGYPELERELQKAWDEAGRTPLRTPLNQGGVQINGNNNSVEYHLHKHPKQRVAPVTVYPIMRHEMIIVPSDGQAPVVFADIAPPRVAVVDKEVSRAYAAHMLRQAKRHGTPQF